MRLRRYPVGVWSAAAVFGLTMLATRYVQLDVSAVYLAAVMFSAWRGGLGAGLLATALSAVLGAFVFFPPAYSFKVYGEDLLRLGVKGALTEEEDRRIPHGRRAALGRGVGVRPPSARAPRPSPGGPPVGAVTRGAGGPHRAGAGLSEV